MVICCSLVPFWDICLRKINIIGRSLAYYPLGSLPQRDHHSGQSVSGKGVVVSCVKSETEGEATSASSSSSLSATLLRSMALFSTSFWIFSISSTSTLIMFKRSSTDVSHLL